MVIFISPFKSPNAHEQLVEEHIECDWDRSYIECDWERSYIECDWERSSGEEWNGAEV